MNGGRSTPANPFAVPRPSIVRDGAGEASSQQLPTASSSSATDSSGQPVLSSPKNLIGKHGFCVTTQSLTGERAVMDFDQPDELRALAIVAMGDGLTDQENERAFINKEYLAAWNPTLRGHLTSDKVQEIAFPAAKKDLDALLRCVWPDCGDAWPLTIKQLQDAVIPCSEWGMHPCLVSTISYYLHSNTVVPVVDKLKLAARCGDALLLGGSLYYQCRRDTICDIAKRSKVDFDQISTSSHAAAVLKSMLEHMAHDDDDEYKKSLIDLIRQETASYKDRCKEMVEFTTGNGPPAQVKAADACADCLLVPCDGEREYESYSVNRAYLASWSPVFRSMFYTDFADRRRDRIPLRLDNGEHRYWHLFLTLIHPCHMCALWRLLPWEYCYSSSGKSVNTLCSKWIDSAFTMIFDGGDVDALMHVFRLAHKFQVSSLVNFCILMIEAKSELTLADKILLADTYHLPTLMAWCLGKLTTARSVKRMFAENEQLLVSLSHNTLRILLELILELV